MRSHWYENAFLFSCNETHFQKKVLHLASLWEWEILEIGNCPFQTVTLNSHIRQQNWKKILKTTLTSFSRTRYDSDVTTCAFKLESSGDRLLDSVFLDKCSSHVHTVFIVLTVEIWRRKRRNSCSSVTVSYMLKPSLFFISCFRLYRIRTSAAKRHRKVWLGWKVRRDPNKRQLLSG